MKCSRKNFQKALKAYMKKLSDVLEVNCSSWRLTDFQKTSITWHCFFPIAMLLIQTLYNFSFINSNELSDDKYFYLISFFLRNALNCVSPVLLYLAINTLPRPYKYLKISTKGRYFESNKWLKMFLLLVILFSLRTSILKIFGLIIDDPNALFSVPNMIFAACILVYFFILPLSLLLLCVPCWLFIRLIIGILFITTLQIIEILSNNFFPINYKIQILWFAFDYCLLFGASLLDIMLVRGQRVQVDLVVIALVFYRLILTYLCCFYQINELKTIHFSLMVERRIGLQLLLSILMSFLFISLVFIFYRFSKKRKLISRKYEDRSVFSKSSIKEKGYSKALENAVSGIIIIAILTGISAYASWLLSTKFITPGLTFRLIDFSDAGSKTKHRPFRAQILAQEPVSSVAEIINPGLRSPGKLDRNKKILLDQNQPGTSPSQAKKAKRVFKINEIVTGVFWIGVFYLVCIPIAVFFITLISIINDEGISSKRGNPIQLQIMKTKMVLAQTASESPGVIFAGTLLSMMVSMFAGLILILKYFDFEIIKLNAFNVLIITNVWITSVVLWLAPFISSLVSLKQRYSSYYSSHIARILIENVKHTVVIGIGDLGKQVVHKVLNRGIKEEPVGIVLPRGQVELLASGLVVIDTRSELFESPTQVGGLEVKVFRVEISRPKMDKELTEAGKPVYYKWERNILIPAIVGDVRHSEIRSLAGINKADTIIGVMRDTATSVDLMDRILERRSEQAKLILCAESSFNLPYSLFRTTRASRAIFIVHPSYLRGTNTAGMILAAVMKIKNIDNQVPSILVIGTGRHIGYMINGLLNIWSNHSEDNTAIAWPDIIIFGSGPAPLAECQVFKPIQSEDTADFVKRINQMEINVSPGVRLLIEKLLKSGISWSVFDIQSYLVRAINGNTFDHIGALFIEGSPTDMPTVERVLKTVQSQLIVLSYLDPIEQLRAIRALNTAVLRWKYDPNSPKHPIILIDAETGAGARSQNIGDAFARDINLQKPDIEPLEFIRNGSMEQFENSKLAISDKSRWFYPNPLGYSSDFQLIGDGMVDVLEDPIEKISGIYDSLKIEKPISVNICAEYAVGCLADISRRIAGIKVDKTSKFPRIPTFLLTHVSSRPSGGNDEGWLCLHCLAYLVDSKIGQQIVNEKNFIRRVIVLPGYTDDEKKPLDFPVEDVKAVQNLLWKREIDLGEAIPWLGKNENNDYQAFMTIEMEQWKDFLQNCPGMPACKIEAFNSHLLVLKSMFRAADSKSTDLKSDRLSKYLEYLNNVVIYLQNKTTDMQNQTPSNSTISPRDKWKSPMARLTLCCKRLNVPGALGVTLSSLIGQKVSPIDPYPDKVLNLRNIGVDHCPDSRFLQVELNGNIVKSENFKKDVKSVCQCPPILRVVIRPVTQSEEWISYAKNLQVFLGFKEEGMKISWAEGADTKSPFAILLAQDKDIYPKCSEAESFGRSICRYKDTMAHEMMYSMSNRRKSLR